MSSAPVLLADPSVELHACLERLAAFDVAALDGGQQAALLGSLTRAEARLSAVRLRVLAVAESSRTAARSGAASTGQWAARVTHADPAAAQRQVALARGLASRTATQQALAAGVISAEHAAVIVRADQDLPPSLSLAQRDAVEAALVDKAAVLTPTQLRHAARRALAAVAPDPTVVDAHENDLLTGEEARARARTRLSLHENHDGTMSGHFTIPMLQGQMLGKILAAMSAPRRGKPGATIAQVGEQGERTDWDRARGLAFCELLEHLPTDHLHPKNTATVLITIAQDALRGALKAAGLDTGGALSAGQARRLACQAGLLPTVLGTNSTPLDLGRAVRLFSETQRRALGIDHHTCAAEGCDRPYAWCELHHLTPWATGGTTNLNNATALCNFHHHRIHDPTYTHTWTPHRTVTFHQRT